VCKIKQNSKCAKNLKYTIFKTEMFVQFSVLVLVLPSSFWGWLLVVGSGLVAGLLFPVFLHNIQLVSLIFFFWLKHLPKTLTMAAWLVLLVYPKKWKTICIWIRTRICIYSEFT